MLPGFRFFVATIVLAASVLIFGLGAAALLRATHEEVAAVPSLRTMPPPLRPQPTETAPPTLALLRVEIPARATEEISVAGEAPPASADELKSPAEVSAIAPSAETAPEPSTTLRPSSSSDNSAESEVTPAPVPSTAEPTAPVAVATAPLPEATSPPIPQVATPEPNTPDTSPTAPAAEVVPAPVTEVAEHAIPAEAIAPAPASVPPTPDAADTASVVASPPAASAPTRVVAVTATGCEILPTAPGQLVAIPEAPRAAQQPAQSTPAQNDKTAKLDPAPTGTIPTPVARPQRTTKTIRKRPVVIRHRHHAPRTRVVRREIIRPQPQPDFFTLLFGGGAPQPAPVRQ